MIDGYRYNEILDMIPNDVETVLDIGSRGDIFRNLYKVKTVDALEQADVVQDLNLDQKLPFEDNSFDIVVLNQMLEHLTYVEGIINEAKRVSKKYIFVGLPNELILSSRFNLIFRKSKSIVQGYNPYGHKHMFRIKKIDEFISKFFGEHKVRRRLYVGWFGNFMPRFLKRMIVKLSPSLFGGETYYIIEVNDEN